MSELILQNANYHSKTENSSIRQIKRAELSEEAQSRLDLYRSMRLASNTHKAYLNGVKKFLRWGGDFPATTVSVIEFIAHIEKNEKLKGSTIAQYIDGINHQQKALGFNSIKSYDVKVAIKAAKRLNFSNNRKGDVFSFNETSTVTKHLLKDPTNKGKRNFFVFLLFLWTGCRTEEIANLSENNIKDEGDRLVINIQKSKRDQDMVGTLRFIPKLSNDNNNLEHLCLVSAFRKYIQSENLILDGKKFIKKISKSDRLLETGVHPKSMRRIIGSALKDAGLSEDRIDQINGHSFRHTLATMASKLNINQDTIKKLGAWKSSDSVSRYTGNHSEQAIIEIANSIG